MVRMKGFQELTPVDEALRRFIEKLQPQRLGSVRVLVEESLGRLTSRKVIASENLPRFDRSAVDGYAVRAEDVLEASQFQPQVLHLVKKDTLGEGETRETWTGNMLPKGADTVIMLEHTERSNDEVRVFIPKPPGANVSKKGEDVRKGEVVVSAGVRVTPYHIGLLAALGVEKVEVVKIPIVAVLATGDELVALRDVPTRDNQIFETNSLMLSGMCAELGASTLHLGIAKDDEDEIRDRIRDGLAKADIVITTGGTSVGVRDLVPKVVEEMEKNSIVAHGIAMRPGMPTAVAVLQGKPVLILSGNPVAAAMGFEVFVRPLMQYLKGSESEERMNLKARLTRGVAGVLGRRVFLRVRVLKKDGNLFAEPIRIKGSSILTTITKASGYVVIPENREGLTEGEQVTVHLFETSRGQRVDV